MKKIIFPCAIFLLGLNMSVASEEINNDKSENLNSEEFFCQAGWDDVNEYFDAGGTDGFYAGYLFCYHCGC